MAHLTSTHQHQHIEQQLPGTYLPNGAATTIWKPITRHFHGSQNLQTDTTWSVTGYRSQQEKCIYIYGIYYCKMIACFGYHLATSWEIGQDISAARIIHRCTYIRRRRRRSTCGMWQSWPNIFDPSVGATVLGLDVQAGEPYVQVVARKMIIPVRLRSQERSHMLYRQGRSL